MTDDNDSFTLTRRGADRTTRTNDIVLGTSPRAPQIKRRKFGDLPEPEELVTSDSGCCCRETECLKHSDPLDTTPIKAQFYAFRMTAFRCNCDPVWSAGAGIGSNIDPIRLYETIDPDIWESDIRQCLGTEQTTVSCTVTATWEWVLGGACRGACQWISQQSEWEWVLADPSACSAPGCTVPDPPATPPDSASDVVIVPCGGGVECVSGSYAVYIASPIAWIWVLQFTGCEEGCTCPSPPATPPTGDSQTASLDCTGTPTATGDHWVLQGVDDSDCNCTPAEPDFDGTNGGQTATTTCDGTKVIDGTATLVDSFWRLTIVDTRDYYGCFGTKLEFFIGLDVVLTYYLENQCGNVRGFCRQCANSFTIYTCGPTQCDIEPEPKICLAPKIADGDYTLGSSCCAPGPATWKLTISGLAGADNCCLAANGTYYLGEVPWDSLKWLMTDPGNAAWAYFLFGDRYGFYSSADDIPFCDPDNPTGAYAWVLSCEGGGMHLAFWDLYNTQGVDPDLGPTRRQHWVTSGAIDCDSPETITWNLDTSGCGAGATFTLERYVAP